MEEGDSFAVDGGLIKWSFWPFVMVVWIGFLGSWGADRSYPAWWVLIMAICAQNFSGSVLIVVE